MANKEISPPGGDLGVGTSGRSGLINALTAAMWFDRDGRRRRGSGVSFGGGRSKRQMKNDMAMMEYQYRLQDELERARTARGVEGSAQKDANAYQAADAFFGGGTIEGVSGAHTPKQIQNVDARPNKGNFKSAGGTSAGWEYADEQLGGEGPQADEDPDITEDGPSGETPQEQAAKVRYTRPDLLEQGGGKTVLKRGNLKGGAASKVKAKQDAFFEASLSPDELSSEEIKQLREEYYGNTSAGDDLRQDAADYAGDVLYPISRRKVSGQKKTDAYSEAEAKGLLGNPSDAAKLKIESPEEIKSKVGTVNEDASIDTGTAGNRPAPKGQSGAVQGPQFNQ